MADGAQQNTTFPSGGTTAHGYLELPESGSGQGVVVVQEWWGLTTHVADVVRRLAAEGFVALAPDLYGGATTHDAPEAMRMMQELPPERAARDLAGAVDHLVGHPAVTSPTVGAIGFCMGGGFVLSLAAQQGERVSAAVPFYGLPQGADLTAIRGAVQGHYGEQDGSVPLDAVREAFATMRGAGVEAELHTYPAGHAFYNDEDLIGTYDPEQAGIAWGRAVAFLRDHVR
ncbi:dienelactone hydrolase family protein [Vallicoccus soli]|uniref:Dienelactone hydrolase family protein n=1 Tax=Vallicoccus soli TaxID=2339232 RepID=A0A3A3YQ77_9ACTN|nr:dienelactone hydrolase family protein [Vallicoccus soli]RJK93383.1 dienelactone hydrolase family protein [Vallicoccus soli]